MDVEALGLPGAAAGAPLDHAVVVALDVQRELGRRGEQRGEQEGVDLEVGAGDRSPALDEREVVEAEVVVVLLDRRLAGDADLAELGDVVGGQVAGARAADLADLGRRRRLAAATEDRAGQVEPLLARRLGDPHQQAHVGAQVAAAAARDGGRDPARDARRLGDRHRLGARQRHAAQPAHPEHVAGRQPVLERGRELAAGDRGEPFLGHLAVRDAATASRPGRCRAARRARPRRAARAGPGSRRPARAARPWRAGSRGRSSRACRRRSSRRWCAGRRR